MTALGLFLTALVTTAAMSTVPVDLECSIAVAQEGRLELRIRNASPFPIDIETYPSVELEALRKGAGREYWAPVDLETGRPYGANQPRRLRMEPGHVRKFEVVPGDLLWDSVISSVLPDRPLAQVVPSGSYGPFVVIQGPGEDRLSSNRLVVTVKDSVLELPSKKQD